MIGVSASTRGRRHLRRPTRRLEIYPQTRTTQAEEDIARLSRFCDFDPTDPFHAWTRMELTYMGQELRRLGVQSDGCGIRFHLMVEDPRQTALVTTGPTGRTLRLQDNPLRTSQETPPQKSRHDRLEAWVRRVDATGHDPAAAPAWAYQWDGLLAEVIRHHDIEAQSLLDRLDRPRFMCATTWDKSRRPRGLQPRLRSIDEAPALSIGGEFDAGTIVVTDLLLSDTIAYRRRRQTRIVLTNDLLPRIAMTALPGMKVMDVLDHPYLRDEGMIVKSVRHSGNDTILTVTPPSPRQVAGAPSGFHEDDSLRTCTISGSIT